MLEIVAFEVEDRRCGLPASCVLEVVRAVAIRPLPARPAGLEGVIDLRGRGVPIFDMRVPLGLPPRPVEPSDHFVIARAGERVIALRVDRATDLVALESEAIESAAAILPGARALRGLGRVADGLVLLYDLERFLSPVEAAAVDHAMTGTEILAED